MVTFTLREGFNRLTTEVQGLSRSLVLEAEQLFQTDDPAVVAALDAHHAVERAESDPKAAVAVASSDVPVESAEAVVASEAVIKSGDGDTPTTSTQKVSP